MTIFQMLEQSAVLTLLGMGIVFAFLVILVLCVSVMGKVIRAIGVDKDLTPAASGNSDGTSVQTGNAGVTAAITAAVNEYRKNNP